MSLEALWVVNFASTQGHGGGVVVFETNRVFGGDSSFVWTGNYKLSGEQLTGRIRVKRHSPGMQSLLGSDDIELDVSGIAHDNQMQLHASVTGDPTKTLIIIFRRIAELP